MTQPAPIKPASLTLPIALLLLGMVSVQIGASLAKRLFPVVGAAGTTAFRLGLSALLLLAVWRPWRVRPTWPETRNIVAYGIAMGWMNFLFYSALSRIPLGIAVAVEFTGPLALAMATSRRPLDFLWIALAAFGLAALLPLGHHGPSLDPAGVALALAAGVCWALYIVFGQKAASVHGGQATALGTLTAAIVIVPLGVTHAGAALAVPAIWPLACAMALLSSALPYSLEMYALRRVPTRTFGVLMSIEPALGAVFGLILLGEALTAIQWAAIACIMSASAGSAMTSRAPPTLLAD